MYVKRKTSHVLRYATVVPLGIPHRTTCKTTLAGYALPKGTQVNMHCQ